MANWFKKNTEDIRYLYHGTSEGGFRRIREEGILPHNGYVWLSKDIRYAQEFSLRKGISHLGTRVLRVKFRPDMLPDKRMLFPGDFITKNKITPSEIEVLSEGKWIPIQQYHDEQENIMPIRND